MNGERDSEALERALGTCDDLVRLSRSQLSAFADGDPEALESLLEARGRLVSSLDGEAECFKRAPGENGGDAETAVGLRMLVRERLKELLRIDEEIGKALMARLEATKDQLITLSRGRQAMRQYAGVQSRFESVYVDKVR